MSSRVATDIQNALRQWMCWNEGIGGIQRAPYVSQAICVQHMTDAGWRLLSELAEERTSVAPASPGADRLKAKLAPESKEGQQAPLLKGDPTGAWIHDVGSVSETYRRMWEGAAKGRPWKAVPGADKRLGKETMEWVPLKGMEPWGRACPVAPTSRAPSNLIYAIGECISTTFTLSNYPADEPVDLELEHSVSSAPDGRVTRQIYKLLGWDVRRAETSSGDEGYAWYSRRPEWTSKVVSVDVEFGAHRALWIEILISGQLPESEPPRFRKARVMPCPFAGYIEEDV